MSTNKCRFCKSTEDLEKLTKHELKIARAKLPMPVNENHVFCGYCRMKIHNYLLKSIEKYKQRKQSASMSPSYTSSTISSILKSSSSESIDTQSSATTSKKSRSTELFEAYSSSQSSSDLSSQRPQQPLVPEIIVQVKPPPDSDDSSDDEIQVPISSEVPGSAALSSVQPLIRRRRDLPEFVDDSRIPIYNRKNFGG